MLKCGLLGKVLPHSYSPKIHSMLGDYEYKLYEKEESDLESFLNNSDVDGLNVTIPYKKTVIPFLTKISDTAKKAGSVNTIVRKNNNELLGYNTDVYGFIKMTEHSGIDVCNKKVLVLGSGGASVAIVTALADMGANPYVISRSGEYNYNNLDIHADAEVIVNTTPVGMYPDTGKAPLELSMFPKLSGVLDIIYNPSYTELLLQAQKMRLKYENGLYMLVAQAKKSSEIFTGNSIDDEEIDKIYNILNSQMKNIVLIGMPGVGKSTIAAKLSELTGRKVVDSDEVVYERTKLYPKDIILKSGEEAFRKIEAQIIADLGKESGLIIATGGGTVVKEENYSSLHQNGIIFWIKRNLDELDNKDRPLSLINGVEALYEQRRTLYKKFADYEVDNKNIDTTALYIINLMKKG